MTPTLTELLDRYATLRDTIQGLDAERRTLADTIKAALQDGHTAQTDLYRAELRPAYTDDYPMPLYRDTFGDAAALEVSTIDPRRVRALIQAGELDPDHAAGIRVRTLKSVALHLIPLEPAP